MSAAQSAMSGTVPRGPSIGVARSRADLGLCMLWIAFLLVATGALNRVVLDNGERYAWLVVDAIVVVALVRNRDFLALVGRHWLLMTWPALAVLSAVWSLAPFVSVYHGLQLAMTIAAGFMFAASLGPQRMVRTIFVALFLMALLSLALNILTPGTSTGWQGAWMGAFSHKNLLGSYMGLFAITSLILLLSGWRPLLTAAGVVLGLALLGLSRSGTAAISMVFVLAVLMPIIMLRRRPYLASLAGGLILLGLAATIAAIAVLDLDPLSMALDSVGKDTTLTGRSLLWNFGIEAFQANPWLGYGYKGYWESEATTRNLLRFVNGDDLWFFHNNFIEVAVAFGVMGPLLLVAGIVWTFARAFRAAIGVTNLLAVWPLALVLLIIVQCFAENPLFYNHSILQFLFAAAAAAAGQLSGASPPEKT